MIRNGETNLGDLCADAYRVKDFMIGGEPLDQDKTYTLGGYRVLLISQGDGFAEFGNPVSLNSNDGMPGVDLMKQYISEDLGGVIGEEYSDPYGQGRIKIIN